MAVTWRSHGGHVAKSHGRMTRAGHTGGHVAWSHTGWYTPVARRPRTTARGGGVSGRPRRRRRAR
eukprot:354166-Prymnesium_polylepis.1